MPRLITRRIGAKVITDRTMVVNLLRLVRRQNREIQQLKHAFLSLSLVLADHAPALVQEMQSKLPEVLALEKIELQQDAWERDVWEAWSAQREQETITGKDIITH